ncbi:MAG: phage tail tape measure protein [Myxococcales bacterium]|nr:phage tail tape measure protein [Myxococcales bacterium]
MADLDLKMALRLIDEATAPLRAVAEAALAGASGIEAASETTEALQAAQTAAATAAQGLGGATAASTNASLLNAQAQARTESAAGKGQKAFQNLKEAMDAARRGTLGLSSAFDAAKQAGDGYFQTAANLKQAAEPIAASGARILGMAKASLDAVSGFDAAIGQAGAAARATDAELAQLRAAAYEAGSSTTLGANAAAQALARLGAAGLSAKSQMAVLNDSLHLAEATGLDAASAAEGLARAMQGFKVPESEVGKLGDILASSSDARGLLDALSKSSASARLGGFGVNDAAAAFEALKRSGIGGEQASSGLQQAFEALSKKGTQDLLKGAGVAMTNADGTRRSLSDILTDLKTKLDGLDASRSGAALDRAFGGGAKAIAAAMENLDALKAREKELGDPDALSKSAERNRSVLMGYADISRGLGASLETLRASVGDALLPAANAAAVAFMGAVNWVSAFARENPVVTKTIVGLATALGGLLAGLGATVKVISMISSAKGALAMISAFAKLAGSTKVVSFALSGIGKGAALAKAAFGGIATAIKGVTLAGVGMAALLVAALAGVVYAGAVVVQNWDHFSEVWSGYWDGLVGSVQTAVVLVLKAIKPLLDIIGIDVGGTIDSLSTRARSNLVSGIAAADKDARDGGAKLWAPDRVLGSMVPGLFGGSSPIPSAPTSSGKLRVEVDVSGQKPRVAVSSDSPAVDVPARAGPMALAVP